MSERTLRRRLADEGVAYRLLLDEVRSSMDQALRSGRATMPVALVAQRLGYGSAAAYLHARSRWRGATRLSLDPPICGCYAPPCGRAGCVTDARWTTSTPSRRRLAITPASWRSRRRPSVDQA